MQTRPPKVRCGLVPGLSSTKIMGPAIQGVLTGSTTVIAFGATICDEANKVFTK